MAQTTPASTQTTVAIMEQPFRLLDLPLEIRREIYRNLLVVGYTKCYIDMRSKKVSAKQSYFLD